jgi:Flp pilus assembly pilin Flp
MIRKLWNDTSGGIISTELVMVASLVTAGILGGVAQFSGSISQEFTVLGTVVAETSNAKSIGIQRSESTFAAGPLSGTEFSCLSNFIAGEVDRSDD